MNSNDTINFEIRNSFYDNLQNKCMSQKVYEQEKTRDRDDGKFQRDFTRIMYSPSFRRMQGKMQLLRIKSGQFLRNRLTHSLEVAQIASSIALERLNYGAGDVFVVVAGALAHDIGNPPFGHAGEDKLNKIFEKIGGFEGNAQTLRILRTIEKKKPEFQGLNLTYRTLLSVVKYFKKKENGSSKFIYDDDYEFLEKFINKNDIKVRTLDAQIVDLSDEISYAAHDLEDGLRIKAFTIDEILHEFFVKYGDSPSYHKLRELVYNAKLNTGCENNSIGSSAYSELFRQELSSSIIHTLYNDIVFVKKDDNFRNRTGSNNSQELGYNKFGELAEGLKAITFRCLTNTNDVFIYEKKGRLLLEYLSDFYKSNTELLPPEYRVDKNVNNNYYQQRLICDYISGMMDSYAISIYEQISGKSFDNILGDLKDE